MTLLPIIFFITILNQIKHFPFLTTITIFSVFIERIIKKKICLFFSSIPKLPVTFTKPDYRSTVIGSFQMFKVFLATNVFKISVKMYFAD